MNQKDDILLAVLIIVTLLSLSAAGYLYWQNQQLQESVNKQVVTGSRKRDDVTANWKIYQGETAYTQDGSSSFTIKYPPDWALCKNVLYPSGKVPTDGSPAECPSSGTADGAIALGVGGHGGPSGIQKQFPAGIANYYWDVQPEKYQSGGYATFNLRKYSYIFEANGIPTRYTAEEYERIFNQIISTFKFSDQ